MSQIFKDDRRIILAPMAGVGDVVFVIYAESWELNLRTLKWFQQRH